MRVTIPIYRQEASDGLADLIAAQAAIAYASPVKQVEAKLHAALGSAFLPAELTEATAKDFDLHPINSIMVTTGWNKNTDVFTKDETWAARFTPEDKPFNRGHDPREIIGHITSNYVVDDDMNLIASNTTVSDVPDKIHIITGAVIYKHVKSKDESLTAEASQLIDEIQQGQWFVSMEVLFSNFDYGLVSATGEQQIIGRCDDTAFLTKKLRAYGGAGIYNGCQLGRVLRNMTFSGKGLVEKPANPESIIFDSPTQVFTGSFASLQRDEADEKHNDTINSGDVNMNEAELKAKLEAALARIEELGAERVQAQLDEKDAAITVLQETVTANETRIEELTTEVAEANKKVETAIEEKTTIETSFATASDELDKIKANAQKIDRIAMLVDKKVDKVDAEAIVAKFETLDDTMFADIVAVHAQLHDKPAEDEPEGSEAADEGGEEDGDDQNGQSEGSEEDPEGEAAADDADLDGSEADSSQDPAMSDDGDDEGDQTMAAFAEYWDQVLNSDKAAE